MKFYSILLLCVIAIVTQDTTAAANDYMWTASCELEVASGRTLKWKDSSAVPIVAHDRKEAEELAREKVEENIRIQFPRLRIVDGTLSVNVSERSAPPISKDESNLVTAVAAFMTGYRVEQEEPVIETPFPGGGIGSKVTHYKEFKLHVTIEDDGGHRSETQGVVNTIGSGKRITWPLPIWKGDLAPYESKTFTITVKCEQPWDDETLSPVVPPRTIGVFKLCLAYTDGQFTPVLTCIESCKTVDGQGESTGSVHRIVLTGGFVKFNATVSSVHQGQLRADRLVAATDREKANNDFREKLLGDPEVAAYNALVSFSASNGFGPYTDCGFGCVFVVSSNPDASTAFVKRVFPGRSDIRIAKDLAEVDSILKAEYEKLKGQPPYDQYKIDESSVRYSIKVKTGLTNIDRLPTLPPRQK